MSEQLASEFAPVFVISNRESYGPENASDFVRSSRFRHFRRIIPDQGWNKQRREWITTDSHDPEYYDVPISVISSFGAWEDGRNRRPLDANSGNSLNVFLQPDPATRRSGVRDPNGRVECYYRLIDRCPSPEISLVVQYWIFHGFSDGLSGLNHQGDWEGIAVAFDRSLKPSFVSYVAHGHPERVPWSNVSTQRGRPISFIEEGTHANLPHPQGAHTGGNEWDTTLTLVRLADQSWHSFAGAWGEVGKIAGTTGPLGPWFKNRFDRDY